MIIQCDRCEKPIQIDNPIVGQKVTCPSCGDVNVLRQVEGAVRGGGRDRAAEAGYPPALGPEVDVMTIRPAMFRAHPLRSLLVWATILAGIVGAIYFRTVQTTTPYLAPISAAVAGLAVLYLIVWKARTLSEGLTITTKRTIDRHGFFSKDTSDVLHVDIKNIQIRQSFTDRLWNVGEIALSSSAEHEDEIEIRNIPDPEKVRRVIDLYRQV
jgi:hypothetical protein